MPRISMERVNIRQNVSLYEEALARHGQFIRWYSNISCWCSDDNGRPDPQCKVCHGRGNRYYPVKQIRRIDRGLGSGSTTISVKENIKSINKVFTPGNVTIPHSSFSGKVITLSSVLKEGKYFLADYMEDLEVSYNGTAAYEGRGIIRVPVVGTSTIHGDFTGEIIEVTSITNTTRSETMNAVSFWEDLILTDSYAEVTDEITVVCKYIKPVKFLISGIKSKIKYEMSRAGITANLQATFPGYYTVGSGDMITLLKAEQKASVVGIASGDFHPLPFFHVSSIVRIEDEVGAITDAVIVRNNEIKWGSRIPNDKFAVSVMFNPTFVVLDDLPDLRYAENKVFPKRVYLKKWDLDSRQNKRPRFPYDTGLGDLEY
ncbi:hypothetical protein LCGC14_2430130 [marine sediment metagenome]|uniref:Uncharacterized protein n=1 Tax=marine sediment metagenome TaxID=412755 RepID=A0A0F9BM86_9ZZZZ